MNVGVRVGGMGDGVKVAVGGIGVAVGGTGVAVGGMGEAVNVAVGGIGVGVNVGGDPTCVEVGVAVKDGVCVGVSVCVGVAVSSLAMGVALGGVGVAAGAQAARSRRTAVSKSSGADNLIRFMASVQSSQE